MFTVYFTSYCILFVIANQTRLYHIILCHSESYHIMWYSCVLNRIISCPVKLLYVLLSYVTTDSVWFGMLCDMKIGPVKF